MWYFLHLSVKSQRTETPSGLANLLWWVWKRESGYLRSWPNSSEAVKQSSYDLYVVKKTSPKYLGSIHSPSLWSLEKTHPSMIRPRNNLKVWNRKGTAESVTRLESCFSTSSPQLIRTRQINLWKYGLRNQEHKVSGAYLRRDNLKCTENIVPRDTALWASSNRWPGVYIAHTRGVEAWYSKNAKYATTSTISSVVIIDHRFAITLEIYCFYWNAYNTFSMPLPLSNQIAWIDNKPIVFAMYQWTREYKYLNTLELFMQLWFNHTTQWTNQWLKYPLGRKYEPHTQLQ